MEVGLKFVLVVLLLPIVQVLPLEWVNGGQYDYTCSSDSVIELRIAEMTADVDSVNATIRLSNAAEEILPYVSLSCHKSGSKSAFDGDSCDLILVNGFVDVVEVKVDTITGRVISNHTLQVVVEVNAVIDEPPPVNLLLLDERKLLVGFATPELELKDNATVLRVVVLNKPLSLGADLELRITLTDEHQQEIFQNLSFSLASDASEKMVEFGGLDPSLVYMAQLSVRNPAQQGSVLLVTPTARLHVALEDVLHKMDTNWRALFDKVSDMYQKASDVFDESVRLHQVMEELLNHTGNTAASSTPVTNSTNDPDPDPDVPTTVPNTTVVPAIITVPTSVPAITTVPTSVPAITTVPNNVTNVTTVVLAITKANPPEVTSVEDSNAYYWLLFAGFVAVLVLCVLGYLLFNRRDKVKVYAVSLWKGAENTGKSSSSKTAGRKYTALPTSIHDTLTHED